jgi:hypothetical protein
MNTLGRFPENQCSRCKHPSISEPGKRRCKQCNMKGSAYLRSNPVKLERASKRKGIKRKGIGSGGGFRLQTHCKYGHEYTPENTLWMHDHKHRGCRACYRRRGNEVKAKLKRDVFNAYGGKCATEGCDVTDIDMLTLDHVFNDGAAERRKMSSPRSASAAYRLAKREGYPARYQVLCANHQLKKEILRKRENRLPC